jgi:nitrogen fixation protein FixH
MTGTNNARQFTGKHMLAIMLGFFAVVLSANMTMVYFARHSWTGLVVANSYVASQEFDTKTRKMEAMAAMDVHPEVSFASGTLRVVLHTKAGDPVPARNVKLSIGRPSNEGQDRVVDMAERASGTFEAPQELGHGQWTGTITAELPGHGEWSRPVRLMVKG